MSTNTASGEKEENWFREWTVPEEDRRKYTSEPWHGERRWFRAANVICFETWRRQRGSK
jgi:hypothetical protein